MEDISLDSFWVGIDQACNIPSNSKLTTEFDGSEIHLNSKKSANGRGWALGPFNLGAWVTKRLKIFPKGRLQKLFIKLNFLLRIMLANYFWRREKNIIITPAVENAIINSCGAGNAWLEKRLKRDLRCIGYPIQKIRLVDR